MDLELLRTFLEVNRRRHFGEAGIALHVTQSAISARIRLLERQLGVKLFVRQYHNLELTPEGHRLVRHADIMLSDWRKARQEVSFGGAKQQMTVGGSLRLWDVALQSWFHTVRREIPELAVIAEVHAHDQLTQRLIEGHLDIAFLLEPPQMETLQVQQVAQIDLLMFSSRQNQSAAEALAGDYIMVDWGLAHALQHRRLYPDAPEPQLRVAQARIALMHMLDLGGAAYIPARMVIDELHEGHLFPVADAAPIERYAYAVYPVRSGKQPLLAKILDYFTSVAEP